MRVILKAEVENDHYYRSLQHGRVLLVFSYGEGFFVESPDAVDKSERTAGRVELDVVQRIVPENDGESQEAAAINDRLR